jgi:hypothetical protein
MIGEAEKMILGEETEESVNELFGYFTMEIPNSILGHLKSV